VYLLLIVRGMAWVVQRLVTIITPKRLPRVRARVLKVDDQKFYIRSGT
jgi:hypothetical protein